MSLATTLLAAAAEAEHGNVALETFVFGAIALAIFALLGFVTFTYRDVANRHAGKAAAYAKAHGASIEQGTGNDH